MVSAVCGTMSGATVYLNNLNTTVSLGPGMPAEPFANRTAAASLASIIDAPSAASSELHMQSTHVWVSGRSLEIIFDFGSEYDLTTLHFWNYHAESHDVDDIDMQFFNASNVQVGSVLNIAPALGIGSTSDSMPIFAENFTIAFPAGVRYVHAVLSGSNSQVDFNNMGFTGEVSDPAAVPEPASALLFSAGCLGLLLCRRYGSNRK